MGTRDLKSLSRNTAASTRRLAKRALLGAWPVVERCAEIGPRGGYEVRWHDSWGNELDVALDAVNGVSAEEREVLRVLAGPTTARKRHALVRHAGMVVGVVSLRRRPGFWEPVSAQCVPGVPLGIDPDHLGPVLHALRVRVHLSALHFDPGRLDVEAVQSYPRYGARLDDDYEAHWPKRGGANYREARKKTRDMEVRIDHPGDLDWIVDTWTEMWLADSSGEVASAEDRKRLWSHQQERGIVHTVMLADAERPVAGCIHYCVDGVVKFECTGRDRSYDRRRVGSRSLDVSFEWAKEAGYEIFDVGGGEGYKHWWAPPYAVSYSCVIRPPILRALRRVGDRTLYT